MSKPISYGDYFWSFRFADSFAARRSTWSGSGRFQLVRGIQSCWITSADRQMASQWSTAARVVCRGLQRPRGDVRGATDRHEPCRLPRNTHVGTAGSSDKFGVSVMRLFRAGGSESRAQWKLHIGG